MVPLTNPAMTIFQQIGFAGVRSGVEGEVSVSLLSTHLLPQYVLPYHISLFLKEKNYIGAMSFIVPINDVSGVSPRQLQSEV